MNTPESWSGQPLQNAKPVDFSYFQLFPYEGLYDYRNPKNVLKYWFNQRTREEFVFNLTTDSSENTNILKQIDEGNKQIWRQQLIKNK